MIQYNKVLTKMFNKEKKLTPLGFKTAFIVTIISTLLLGLTKGIWGILISVWVTGCLVVLYIIITEKDDN